MMRLLLSLLTKIKKNGEQMSHQFLNQEMLEAQAPSIFATEPDKHVSSRYKFYPTTDVLDILHECDWVPYSAQQVRTRVANPMAAKHLIRLRQRGTTPSDYGLNDSFPEMVLMNAHNGMGSYLLRAGIFRMVCSNGMIVSESDFGEVTLRHIGSMPEQVMKASRVFTESTSRIAGIVNTWKDQELTPDQEKDFFVDAARIRFDNPDDSIILDVSNRRRKEDQGHDLWSVFNVAQENLIRGGFLNGQTRRRVRAITAIQKDVNLNSNIWALASKYSREVCNN